MKKSVFLLFAAIVLGSSVVCSACQDSRDITEARQSRPFKKIEVKGSCDVKFVQGTDFEVKVAGAEKLVRSVETRFQGHTLIIDMKKRNPLSGKIRKDPAPVVYVTSPDLISIRMVGTGNFEIADMLDTDTLKVYLRGTGDIDFKKVVCDEFYATVLGVGDVSVGSLTSQRSVLTLKGVGNMDINFVNSGSATCTLHGVGDMKLSGTLKSLQKKIHGVGDINMRKLKLEQQMP